MLLEEGSQGRGHLLKVRDLSQHHAQARHVPKLLGAVTVTVTGICRDNLSCFGLHPSTAKHLSSSPRSPVNATRALLLMQPPKRARPSGTWSSALTGQSCPCRKPLAAAPWLVGWLMGLSVINTSTFCEFSLLLLTFPIFIVNYFKC